MYCSKRAGRSYCISRKIIKGGADKSYGIQVAKLAGVPDSVIQRAKELVEELSAADITEKVKEMKAEGNTKTKKKKYDQLEMDQISLFDTVREEDIIDELKEIEISTLTPIDALNTLYRLQNKLKNRW